MTEPTHPYPPNDPDPSRLDRTSLPAGLNQFPGCTGNVLRTV